MVQNRAVEFLGEAYGLMGYYGNEQTAGIGAVGNRRGAGTADRWRCMSPDYELEGKPGGL